MALELSRAAHSSCALEFVHFVARRFTDGAPSQPSSRISESCLTTGRYQKHYLTCAGGARTSLDSGKWRPEHTKRFLPTEQVAKRRAGASTDRKWHADCVLTIRPLYDGNLWSPGPKRLIGVQLYIRRLDATLPPQYSRNSTPMDKMRPPGVKAISLNPLTDKLLNFDSTYLLDITSIIGRSLVQL